MDIRREGMFHVEHLGYVGTPGSLSRAYDKKMGESKKV
jgi:hypothetical protein